MSETTITDNGGHPTVPVYYSGDVPAVVAFRVRRDGGHMKVSVFIGQENAPGHCGDLTMRPKDFRIFRNCLRTQDGPLWRISYEGDTHSWIDDGWIDDEGAPRVSEKRVQEILDRLNGFIDVEYEGGTILIDGRAVSNRVAVGADFNLDKAVDWALNQRDVKSTCGPSNGTADVELSDGTILEFVRAEKQWAVTISDEPAAVTA